ncbi:pilus assembly protein [Hyphococcus flavus]|uniref:Pilus assembly protein n=1 Tax=Hyphococcus flavus TaxID=1866326 RepID=A0AAF0CDN9_9PROT|nr:TadE family protein [Hyphococcus flavus]WDI29996.1 pilus assembly protein [Hyphococcus flavus]
MEFAIVAPVFLALVFSILEAGWYFFVTSSVETATTNAARLIRTGQAQSSDMSRDAFFNEICRVVDQFGACDDKLTIDISSFSSFGELAADLSDPVCRDKDDPSIEGAQFDKNSYGGQRDIVRVRVCFLYKPINPGLGMNLRQTDHGGRKIISVNIFRNEPFGGAQNDQ